MKEQRDFIRCKNLLRELSLESRGEILLSLMYFVNLKTGLLYLEKLYPATPICTVHKVLWQDLCQELHISNLLEKQSHIRLIPILKLINISSSPLCKKTIFILFFQVIYFGFLNFLTFPFHLHRRVHFSYLETSTPLFHLVGGS